MRCLLRVFLSSWLLVSVAAGIGCERARASRGETAPPPGDGVTLSFYRNPAAVAPFTVRDIDGRQLSSADWRGKVVFVNFWATWCGPCRAEIPALTALQDKYRDRLIIIGVSEDEGPLDGVKQFAAAQKMNYPIVMLTPELTQLFPGVGAIPTTFVLDRESRLVQKHVGLFPPERLELETRALAGLPVNARIEEVDRTQKANLENSAQATNIPGVDLAKLTPEKRAKALQQLNSEGCTCGCDFSIAKCRIDDPGCGVSLPKARQIVESITAGK